ncbi:hypothetical protein [Streptomyces sp. NBC_00448]|uniref:hypothetical protein n=1 Tax=Streptomyces sp. NBC_00448 TaxID=2903652 RepID=UPI002E2079FB
MTSRAKRSPTALVAAAVTVPVAALVSLTGSARAGAAGATGFVQRCGTDFRVDGRTAFFAAATSYDLFTHGSGSGDTETRYMDRSAIDQGMSRELV